ncbi:membrane protein [Bifidobacterium mongoliense DSM 21395]|uniref:Membrane protein n=2 Tax=Bifidobacterium mongoliense TaxID=518643 RepID=A0A087CAQ8_9BIFI|nr:membrane protein [Bifidobacterium mongoliense DSM 21395]
MQVGLGPLCDDMGMPSALCVPDVLHSLSEAMSRIWTASTGLSPSLAPRTALLCAALALLAVMVNRVWSVSRNLITILHEGGHACVALLLGRRLEGIRLHVDTSGVTTSVGRARGPGLTATRFAGYAAPPLCGLGCAALVAHGLSTGVLWLLVLVLLWLVTRTRNAYGWLAILATAGPIVAIAWYGDPVQRAMVAHGVVWFMAFGSLRTLCELIAQRARGQGIGSDADQLALTGMPAWVWITLWLLLCALNLWCTARWLVALP